MSATKHSVVWVLLLGFFSGFCHAQSCTVQGVALLKGNPEGRATVQLLDTSRTQLLGFKVTDEQGRYRFEELPAAPFVVRLSQLGYEDVMIVGDCAEGKVVTLGPDSLTTLSVELAEISVIDRAVILQRRGDTTQINFKQLERGHEQSVTDILESVPGLEVQANRFKFEGKSVDMVLIDNLNLSGADQKRLTDGIFYESVAGIEVIENYSILGRADPDSSNAKRVINISLLKENQNKGQLSLNASGGYQNVYHVGGNYLVAGPGKGWRAEVTGLQNDEEIQEGDDGGLDELVRSGLFDHRYVWLTPFALTPNRSFGLPEGRFTQQQQLRLFYEERPTSGTRRLNARLAVAHTESATEEEGFRDYLDRDTRLSVRGTGEHDRIMLSGELDFTSVLGQQGEADLWLPLELGRRQFRQTDNLSLFGNEFSNSQQETNDRINLRPLYHLRWNYASGWWLSVLGRGELLRTSGQQEVLSNDSIALPSTFLADQNQFLARQESGYRRNSAEQHVRLSRKFGNLLLRANAATSFYGDELDVTTAAADQRPFSGQNQWSLTHQSLLLSARMDHQKIRYSLKANAQHYRTALDQRETSDFRVDPELFFLYKLSKKFHLSTSYRVRVQLPNLDQTNDLQVQRNQIELVSGGLASVRPTLKRSVSLSLFKPVQMSLGGGALFNLNLVYSPSYQAPRLTTQVLSRFQQTSFTYAQVRREWVGDLFFYKSNRSSSYQLKATASSSSFELDGREVADKFLLFNGGVSWKDLGNFLINIMAEAFYQNRTTEGGFSSKSLTLSPQLTAKYVRPGSVVAVHNNLRYNDFGFGRNSYYRFDVTYTRKKVFEHLELSLQALDLLNLKADVRSYSTIGQNYFETRNVRVLPGRLMVGLKWYVHR